MQLFKCCWMGSFFQMLWYHINHASSKCMYLLWIFPHLVILALLSWSIGFPAVYYQWALNPRFLLFFWCIPWNPIDFHSVIFHWYPQQRVFCDLIFIFVKFFVYPPCLLDTISWDLATFYEFILLHPNICSFQAFWLSHESPGNGNLCTIADLLY